MPRDTSACRSYVFTLNNYTDENEAYLRDTFESDAGIKYIAWGREVGESGTPHLQGMVEFSNALTLAGAKRRLGIDRIHLERRRGTPAEARDYCKKDGEFEEYGTLPASGKRTGFSDFVDAARDPKRPFNDLAVEFPGEFIRYHRGATALRATLNDRPRTFKSKVFWVWGSTGVGKSRLASEIFPGAYWKPPGKWWDGYNGESTVILDDLRGRDFEFNYLLRLLDRYPLRVEYKGGSANFAPETIFITSSTAPNSSYSNDSEDLAQLSRRIEYLLELTDSNFEAVASQIRDFISDVDLNAE